MVPIHSGALALDCHSCVDLGDGGCSPDKMKTVTCPASTHVCVETVAAVQWSHGKFSIVEKGCGLGEVGTNDKAVELHGILAFSQLRQCNSSHCNNNLDIKQYELQPSGNESTRVPNNVECYTCSGSECETNNASIVKCYDTYKGCFHGNVTMKAGNFSLTRPIKGCIQDEECTKATKGSTAINLLGSCCSGSLCNADLSNKTHFAARIPPLVLLTAAPGTKNNTPATTASGYTHSSMPAPSTTSKTTRSVTATPSWPSHDGDHAHHHGHGDHDDYHDHDDQEITLEKNGSHITTVKVEERQNQISQKPSGSSTALSASIILVLLLVGLLL
ncbi:ly6/PLAUR domain-containing protein 3 isoform X2 [Hemicordylus capensis]|uniref:ly6/PLAUR domain-containing protein 3 isoform X2 n=1 Tax=Hemicordylus capensis TaxID=884348 RepID=UPI002302086F|nr:ly6/PLAUR domain-containing protein 3 isoform X2 [Hemicordylus capensis]